MDCALGFPFFACPLLPPTTSTYLPGDNFDLPLNDEQCFTSTSPAIVSRNFLYSVNLLQKLKSNENRPDQHKHRNKNPTPVQLPVDEEERGHRAVQCKH